MQILQMRLSQPEPTTDAAAQRADDNWAENANALESSQPWLGGEIVEVTPDVSWIFARDGSLTAMRPGERWWAGCSLPRRAARFMLKSMNIGGTVACFLSPMHAAQVRAALDRLEAQQAIVAIVPDAQTLAVMLHCDNFSRDIGDHRLWFVTGEQWAEQLRRVFQENPGLPTPVQFIRPILADSEPVDRLIAPAQKVFADETARRAERIRSLTENGKRASRAQRVCVIAPSGFRLWDTPADVLLRFLSDAATDAGLTVMRFDSDDPASASPLALAEVLSRSDAVFSANVLREDAPGTAASELPWITWVTAERLPSPGAAGPRDRLLLAEADWQQTARDAGWASDRLHLAAWPALARREEGTPVGFLALVADTLPLDPPDKVSDYSSHLLLWELIQSELTSDPFVIGPFVIGKDVDRYLSDRMGHLQIATEGFDRRLFLDRLIVPAYQHGLARLLIGADLPVRFFGKGWGKLPEFASYSGGPIGSRELFDEVTGQAAALIHAWPAAHAHPIDAAGAVVRAFGRRRESFLRDARLACQGVAPAIPGQNHPLSAQTLAHILSGL